MAELSCILNFRNSRVCVSQLELSFWTMIDTKDSDLHHSIPISFIYQVLLRSSIECNTHIIFVKEYRTQTPTDISSNIVFVVHRRQRVLYTNPNRYINNVFVVHHDGSSSHITSQYVHYTICVPLAFFVRYRYQRFFSARTAIENPRTQKVREQQQ